jgi:hypothetical protein
MQKAAGSRIALPVYTFSIALCSLIVLGAMLLSPSEAGNTVILGLSLPRLAIAVGFLCVFLLFSALSYRAIRDRGWAERLLDLWFGGGRLSRWLAGSAGIGLGLGWIGCFLPPYQAGVLEPHWNRIQPVMIFLLSVSIVTLALFFVMRRDPQIRGKHSRSVFRLSGILFIISLPLLVLMLSSKYDAYRLEDFWYGAGVPLLPTQLILTLLAGIIFLRIGRHGFTNRSDVIVFWLLYGITAALWALEPLEKSFLFIGPHEPNQVLYPFADAATFDLASQFGLIGQGIYIFDTPFFERTLYLAFLIYLHSFFGQNYELLMAVQAAVFAILPPIIYWIGRSLNMRAVGFTGALIALWRGINSIAASNLIDLSNPKMILTDFPAAIGVALIVLFCCEWLRNPDKKWTYALWTGGAIGLTIMLRTNGLVFLALVPFFALFRYAPKWKNWLVASALLGFAVIAITLPWELRNVSRGAPLYGPIVTKIEHVIRTRYPLPADGPETQNRNGSPFTIQQIRPLSFLIEDQPLQDSQACQTIACFAPIHFIHNINTSILLLPTSPVMDDLWHTVKRTHPYWRPDWNGIFTPSSLFFFALNVFFISLGISMAWKHQRLPGLVPLTVFAIYNISNAFARTSGGRYIVPADWIITLYFIAGVLFVITEAARYAHVKLGSVIGPVPEEHSQRQRQAAPAVTAVLLLLLLFGLGSLVPLSEKLYAPRYADFDFTGAMQKYETDITETGLTNVQIETFLREPNAEWLVGRALYPRFYKAGQGEIAFPPYKVMEFSRTGFMLAGPKGSDAIVLPGSVPAHFPHAEDVLVIGCREQEHMDALVVILLDGSNAVYTRSPLSPRACPLEQPVCESEGECP